MAGRAADTARAFNPCRSTRRTDHLHSPRQTGHVIFHPPAAARRAITLATIHSYLAGLRVCPKLCVGMTKKERHVFEKQDLRQD
jgi:hypothetical protein